MINKDENGKIDILSLTQDELIGIISELGEKSFRAKQIFQWLHLKRVNDFSEMTNISAQLRSKLNDIFV